MTGAHPVSSRGKYSSHCRSKSQAPTTACVDMPTGRVTTPITYYHVLLTTPHKINKLLAQKWEEEVQHACGPRERLGREIYVAWCFIRGSRRQRHSNTKSASIGNHPETRWGRWGPRNPN